MKEPTVYVGSTKMVLQDLPNKANNQKTKYYDSAGFL